MNPMTNLAKPIAAERAGDFDFTWVCMATRRDNARLKERILKDMGWTDARATEQAAGK